MKLYSMVKMYIGLFFSINKNNFFEKYKFIKINQKNRMKFYITWFILKNYVLMLLGVFLLYRFSHNSYLCGGLLVVMLLSEYLSIDANDWKTFERSDFILAFPKSGERCMMVLLGNIIYRLFMNSNVLLYGILAGIFFGMSVSKIIIAIGVYMFVYILLEMACFMVRFSSINIKKIYSFLGYVFSMISTGLIMYIVIESMIYVMKYLISKQISKQIIIDGIKQVLLKGGMFISKYQTELLLCSVVLAVLVVVSFVISLKDIKEAFCSYKDRSKYTVRNFLPIRAVRSLERLFVKETRRRAYLEKEYALFADVFRYNYHNFWFVFLPDRSIAFLLAIAIAIYRHNFSGSEVILMGLFSCIMLIDICSAISAKMPVNMSFVAEYNTLMFANTNGIPLKEILNSKLDFYYVMKMVSNLLFFVIINIVMYVFKCGLFIFAATNILCLLILILIPKCYIIGNLIYTRINYKNYEKYLEESQILESGVEEFILINILFRIISSCTIFACLLFLFGPILGIHPSNMLIGILLFSLFSIAIITCNLLMKRVGNNIVSFIEGGDYSADFSKILKK